MCCVPNCRGNYNKDTQVFVFSFPKCEEMKQLWLKKIPRADYELTKNSVVCAVHFKEEFIVRYDEAKRDDGSILRVKRSWPKVSEDAYPSIFPDCPKYLSEEPASKRRKPEKRREEADQRDETVFQDFLERDKISSFEEFCTEARTRVTKQWRQGGVFKTSSEAADQGTDYSFYRICDIDSSVISASPGCSSTCLPRHAWGNLQRRRKHRNW